MASQKKGMSNPWSLETPLYVAKDGINLRTLRGKVSCVTWSGQYNAIMCNLIRKRQAVFIVAVAVVCLLVCFGHAPVACGLVSTMDQICTPCNGSAVLTPDCQGRPRQGSFERETREKDRNKAWMSPLFKNKIYFIQVQLIYKVALISAMSYPLFSLEEFA